MNRFYKCKKAAWAALALLTAAGVLMTDGCKALSGEPDKDLLKMITQYSVTETIVIPAEETGRVQIDKTFALEDERITLRVEEHTGEFFNLNIETVEPNIRIPAYHEAGSSEYYFFMPNGDVRVKAHFTADPGYNAFLGALSVSQETLEPAFNRETTLYTVKLPQLSAELALTFSAEESGAVIDKISPLNVPLNEGKNSIVITVTSPNGLVSTPYTVNVEVKPTLNVTGLTVRSVPLQGIEYTKPVDDPPAAIEFNYMPYVTGATNQVNIVVAADPAVNITSGGGNFNLNNSGAQITRNITVTRSAGGLSNSANYIVRLRVYEGNPPPALKIADANMVRIVYDEGTASWGTAYGISQTKDFTVITPFNGTALLSGGGGGGGGGDNVGGFRTGKNGNGGDVLSAAYAFAAATYSAVIGAGGSGGASTTSSGSTGGPGGTTELKDAGGAVLFSAAGGLPGRGTTQGGGNNGNVRDGANAGAYRGIAMSFTEFGRQGAVRATGAGNTGKGGGAGGGTGQGSDRPGRAGGSGVIFIAENY
jgi:hypothetical protein